MSTEPKLTASHLLTGEAESAKLLCSIKWKKALAGSPEQWPHSFRVFIETIPDTPFPMYIAWGPDRVKSYNDAFRLLPGELKHPQAMGISSRVTFAEIVETVGQPSQHVYNSYPEECYFNRPIRGKKDDIKRGKNGILIKLL